MAQLRKRQQMGWMEAGLAQEERTNGGVSGLLRMRQQIDERLAQLAVEDGGLAPGVLHTGMFSTSKIQRDKLNITYNQGIFKTE